MKKLGFTLTEVLLSMAIIGVVASITAPSLMNLIPNKDKIQTLKYYKLITDINANLLNDRSIYVDGVFDNVHPLNENYNSPIISQADEDLMTRNKYGFFLMENLEVDGEPEEFESSKVTFKTIDGYTWEVETGANKSPKSITIDKNGTDGPNSFGSHLVKNPDRFKFNINPTTGEVSGADTITIQYLKHKNRLGNKKNDYICAFTPNSNDCDDDL